MGFAPYGDSLDSLRSPCGPACGCYYASLRFFACAKKVSKETHPCIRARRPRPALHHRSRGTTGCGPPTKGRPWPITALAASMPLNPFHGDSTRPPEGDLGVVSEIALQEQKPNATNVDLPEISQARVPAPGAALGRGGISRSETRMQGNADQTRLPTRPFVGAPPRGEALQLRIALVRGGAPLLPIRSIDA